MKQKYSYGTKKYIAPGKSFNLRFRVLTIFALIVVVVFVAFVYDFLTKNTRPETPISKTTVKNVTFENKFFSTPYFRFTDSEDWKLIPSQSTNNKFVFHKYLRNSEVVQHQLIVYINTTPNALDLSSSRVLPVTLNSENNSFVPSSVSQHCGKTYGQGELHKVQTRQVDGATLLCDPDQGQFRVVISKAGGDYNLKLKRADGTTANYIIIYQNQKIDPDTQTIMRIADSFQSI